MAWKQGPLPPNTWMWGGVTTEKNSAGFYFADFCGDHVMIERDGLERVEAADVVMYDNSLELPPNCPEGSTRLK